MRAVRSHITEATGECWTMIDWAKHLPKSAQPVLWVASIAAVAGGAFLLIQ